LFFIFLFGQAGHKTGLLFCLDEVPHFLFKSFVDDLEPIVPIENPFQSNG
jgi:hypothetical protein